MVPLFLFFTKIFYKSIGSGFSERIKFMKKIVLIGAGSQNFGLGVIGDIFKCSSVYFIVVELDLKSLAIYSSRFTPVMPF